MMRGLLVALLAAAVASAQHDADVVVYGSTPGAITAAVAAARQGANTILVDPAPRVGGMCSGGLGRTDRGNSVVIGGYAQEFFARNRAHYHPGTPIHSKPGTICQTDTHGDPPHRPPPPRASTPPRLL